MNINKLIFFLQLEMMHSKGREVKSVGIFGDEAWVNYYDSKSSIDSTLLKLSKQLRVDLRKCDNDIAKCSAYSYYKQALYGVLKTACREDSSIVRVRIHNAYLNYNKYYQRYKNKEAVVPIATINTSLKYSDIKADDKVTESIIRRYPWYFNAIKISQTMPITLN